LRSWFFVVGPLWARLIDRRAQTFAHGATDNEIDALGGTTLELLDANASLDNAVIFEARVSQVSEVRLADYHRAIAAFFARLHCEDGLHRCG